MINYSIIKSGKKSGSEWEAVAASPSYHTRVSSTVIERIDLDGSGFPTQQGGV